jgi:hypothetical protein
MVWFGFDDEMISTDSCLIWVLLSDERLYLMLEARLVYHVNRSGEYNYLRMLGSSDDEGYCLCLPNFLLLMLRYFNDSHSTI